MKEVISAYLAASEPFSTVYPKRLWHLRVSYQYVLCPNSFIVFGVSCLRNKAESSDVS